MTLTQYLTNPTVVDPIVVLSKCEYQIILTKENNGDTIRFISIPALHELLNHLGDYVQLNEEKQLYKQDRDGNPQYKSMFHIQ